MKIETLTICIPCRDEGQDLNLLLGGLNSALRSLPPELKLECFFAVNGSSSSFLLKVSALIAAHPIGSFDWTVIETQTGKLNAQRTVVEQRLSQGPIAFIDSDVLLEPNVLSLLIQELEQHPECHVSYAQPVPVFPRPNKNLLHRFMRVHYALRERSYSRRFFHGRTFIMRSWFWESPSSQKFFSSSLADRLSLAEGPLVDDIVLSLSLIHI